MESWKAKGASGETVKKSDKEEARLKYFSALKDILKDGNCVADKLEIKVLNGLFLDYVAEIEISLRNMDRDLLMENHERKSADLKELLENELDDGNEIGIYVNLYRFLEALREGANRVELERKSVRKLIEQLIGGDEEVEFGGMWMNKLDKDQRKMFLEEAWRVYFRNLDLG